jgi:hypothetical protein
MAEARLAAGLWVAAYLKRLGLANIPAYIVRRGDEVAGAVLVKCARLDGTATLWQREWDFETDTRPWRVVASGPEAEVDAAAARARARDPDLWIVEIESRDGRTLLKEEGLF